ncbi:MAG: uncharacterized protein A8A55_2639 [Amphiamblys sp. WSBS2006]|nr:MAG: uncharacterized protein A8A55_2639 [Amphiamblys sp. WSBS2006]
MMTIRTNFASCGGILFFDRREYIETTTGKCFSDIEMELLDVKRQKILRDMERKGIYIAPAHLKEKIERRKWEQPGNNGTTPEPRLVDSLVLTVAELSAGPVLLGPETTVYLPDTGLSDALFFRLLNKTKVVLGGTVSLFKHLDGNDCIKEGVGVECREEVRLSPAIKNNTLFMENVAGLPDKSIYLWGVKSLTLKDHTANLLPKLWLHDDNVMEELWLDVGVESLGWGILFTGDRSIWLGKVKNLRLEKHAVNLLPKLKLHEDNVVEVLRLSAWERLYVSEMIFTGDRSIWLGKVKNLRLEKHAIDLLPKLKLHDDNVMEVLRLSAWERTYVSSILAAKDNSIWLGKVKNLRLEKHAVNILSKLKLDKDNVMGNLSLDVELGEDVSYILAAEDRSIWVGRVKSLKLERYAINLLPKLWLHDDNVMEWLYLSEWLERYISYILCIKDSSIRLGKVKSLKLERYGINALPKLKLHEDNVMDVWLSGWQRDISEILLKKDRTICVGRVKSLSLEFYAISILPKLWLHEDNVMEYFWLYADRGEYVSEIFGAEDSSIWLGKVKKSLRLELYAISILPKLRSSTMIPTPEKVNTDIRGSKG